MTLRGWFRHRHRPSGPSASSGVTILDAAGRVVGALTLAELAARPVNDHGMPQALPRATKETAQRVRGGRRGGFGKARRAR